MVLEGCGYAEFRQLSFTEIHDCAFITHGTDLAAKATYAGFVQRQSFNRSSVVRPRLMQFATQSLDTMLKRRCVPLRGTITGQSATECIAQLLFLASQRPQKPLTLCVDSVGGLIAESIAIIRTIDELSCPVATFCHGDAGGTAAVIVAHGRKGARVAVPSACFAFAPVFADSRQGHVEAQFSQFPQALVEILSEDARKHELEILGWFKESIEFVSEQALTLGLIDSVSTESVSLREA